MEKIKSFIYLDEYKMYSISAQMSGGITEESQFSGKLENEIIIDPIAIYREI